MGDPDEDSSHHHQQKYTPDLDLAALRDKLFFFLYFQNKKIAGFRRALLDRFVHTVRSNA